MLAVLQDSIFSAVAGFLRLAPADLARVLLKVGLVWALAWGAWRVVNIIARRIVAAVNDGDDTRLSAEEKRGHTLAQLLRSVGRVIILGIAVLLTLDVFIDIGPLLAGAGILGLAVSFGAQSLVKDVISGFFLLLENQFAVGDVIEAAGKTGVVERMTLRVVMLRDLHGVLHVIPNGQITTVSNQTRGWAQAVVEIGVPYGTDVDEALAVFRDEAGRFAADPAWRPLLDGEPEVPGVERLAEHAVILRTLLRTRPGEQWPVAREFRRRMLLRLAKEGIEIPFPQRTVHVRHRGPAAPGSAGELG
jgi:small conductance mechanosensitive channel